jgi:predicted transcriptional regulator
MNSIIALKALIKAGISGQRELAQALGISRSWVNLMLQILVERGELALGPTVKDGKRGKPRQSYLVIR